MSELYAKVQEFLDKGGKIDKVPDAFYEELKIKARWTKPSRGRKFANYHCLQIDPLVEKIFGVLP